MCPPATLCHHPPPEDGFTRDKRVAGVSLLRDALADSDVRVRRKAAFLMYALVTSERATVGRVKAYLAICGGTVNETAASETDEGS